MCYLFKDKLGLWGDMIALLMDALEVGTKTERFQIHVEDHNRSHSKAREIFHISLS